MVFYVGNKVAKTFEGVLPEREETIPEPPPPPPADVYDMYYVSKGDDLTNLQKELEKKLTADLRGETTKEEQDKAIAEMEKRKNDIIVQARQNEAHEKLMAEKEANTIQHNGKGIDTSRLEMEKLHLDEGRRVYFWRQTPTTFPIDDLQNVVGSFIHPKEGSMLIRYIIPDYTEPTLAVKRVVEDSLTMHEYSLTDFSIQEDTNNGYFKITHSDSIFYAFHTAGKFKLKVETALNIDQLVFKLIVDDEAHTLTVNEKNKMVYVDLKDVVSQYDHSTMARLRVERKDPMGYGIYTSEPIPFMYIQYDLAEQMIKETEEE